jgi:hypothetical protein
MALTSEEMREFTVQQTVIFPKKSVIYRRRMRLPERPAAGDTLVFGPELAWHLTVDSVEMTEGDPEVVVRLHFQSGERMFKTGQKVAAVERRYAEAGWYVFAEKPL